MAKLLGNQFVEDLPGPGTRLMQALIATQQRREERERQKRLDAIAEEERQRKASLEEEQRQIRALEFAQKMAALQDPQKKEVVKTVEVPDAPSAREQWIEPEPSAAESAAYLKGLPRTETQIIEEVDAPSQPVQTNIGGIDVSVPMLNRAEIQSRADQDFQTKLDQARKLEVARGATELTPEIIASLPESLRPFFQPGQLASAPSLSGALTAMSRPGVLKRAVIDGQDVMVTDAELAQAKAEGKDVGFVPPPRTGQDGLTDMQHRDLMNITTKYQDSTMLKQADQGAIISKMADQIVANPETATNQLKAIYLFVKNLDPNSAVREGELDLAQLAHSYKQQIENMWVRLGEGRIVNPQVAKEMAQAAKDITTLWEDGAKRVRNRYIAQAGIAGVGPRFEKYLGHSDRLMEQSEPGGEMPLFNTTADLKAAIQSGKVKSGDKVRIPGGKVLTVR